MKKRICFLLAVCLLISTCFLVAKDFWETKKFSTWSEDEIAGIMKDSPWAGRTYLKYVMGSFGGGRGGGMPPGGGGTPVSGAVTGGGGGMMGGGGMPGGGGGMMGGGRGGGDPIPVIVRWHSSLPIKQAVACLRFKKEVETSKEAAEMLSRQETTYIVGVIGLPGQEKMYNKDRIKAGCQLIIEGKPPIQAVEVMTSPDGENTNIYVAFPRFQNNEPLVSLKDKEVQVMFKIPSGFGAYEVKKKFNLKNMVFQGNLEI
jgi:hypothetical protein